MTEDRDALIAHYRATFDDLDAAIDGLSDGQLTDPSIDGWSVKDHLAHLAMWDNVRALDIARISAGHDTAWQLTKAQDDAYNAISYKARRGFSLDQARWELDHSRRALLDAIAAANPRGLEAERYGSAGLRSGHHAEHAGWIRRWRSERGR